jgi:Spy/CpxP family protein refolding chaperone
MIPLAIGLGILGFAAMRRAHRRCHYGYARGPWHHGYYGYGGYGGWGGHHHHDGRRWVMNAVLERLDATPAQERAIVAELEKLEERVHTAKRNLRDARGDLAAAIRGPVLDDAALGAVLGRVDSATAEIRAAGQEALRGIHAVLDDKQRERLAGFLDGGWWRRGGGPYRV